MNGTPAFEQGNDDFTSITDNGTGDGSLNLAEPFRRVPVVLALGGSDTSVNGAITAIGTPSATAPRITSYDATGTGAADDGTVNALIIGWDSDVVHNSYSPEPVVCTNIAPRLIPLVLTAPGTVTEGKHQVSASGASNRTTITFNRPFAAAPIVVGMPDTLGNTLKLVSSSVSQIVIDQFTHADAAATNGMHLWVLGQDEPNRIGKLRRRLKVTQFKPRLIAGIISQSGSVYSATNYSDLGTFVRNGAGDVTITFARAFLRAPVVVAVSDTSASVAVTAVSTTACTIKVSTTSGAGADPSTMHIGILGFDAIDQIG